jgi:hypothetical protein
VWIFFDNPVLAVKARRLGNAILTEAMSRNEKISFKSYDVSFLIKTRCLKEDWAI